MEEPIQNNRWDYPLYVLYENDSIPFDNINISLFEGKKLKVRFLLNLNLFLIVRWATVNSPKLRFFFFGQKVHIKKIFIQNWNLNGL